MPGASDQKEISVCSIFVFTLCLMFSFALIIVRIANTDDLNYVINTQFLNLFNEKEENQKTFTILPWTSFYGKKIWNKYKPGPFAFSACKYKNCNVTYDKVRLNESDAILVHMRSIGRKSNLPNYHLPQQKWIMYMFESPVHKFLKYSPFNDVFNATMTYKYSSDIYAPSGQVSPGKDNKLDSVWQNIKSKTKLVAWFVSNCKTQSRREVFVKKLQEYIPVHIYGKCGPYACARPISHTGQKPCHNMLERDYKFYLAFENSLCHEYITEKLWEALKYNVVPIVLGLGPYSKLLPRKSYIDIHDFASVSEISDYLLLLDRNESLYSEYFDWKARYHCSDRSDACALCEYMNNQDGVYNTIKRPDLFWNEHRDCISAKQYYGNLLEGV